MSHELGVIRMRIGEAVRMLQGARERPAGAMEEGGDTDFSQEKFKRRLGDFKSSKEKQQESMAKQAKGLLQQALAAYEKKDYWNSITLAEGAIQLDPGMAEAYMALGMAQAKNPKWGKKALAALEKAVSMDPLSEKIHLVFIEVLVEKNLKSRAKAEAQKLLESHPDSAAGKALLKSIGK
jgi:tetratricopeptide (TPR) repeat protein